MRRTGRAGTRRLRATAAALTAAGTLVLAACGGGAQTGGAESGEGGRLSIATGNTTGVYYVLGGGYADIITKHLDGYQATAESTAASVENIQRVVRGDSDIAFTLADSAADAVNGEASFSEPQPIRALMRIYTNYTHVVALKSAGVDRIADLKGKRVATGAPNSGTEVIALRMLEAAGLDPEKDVKAQPLDLEQGVAAMKDGTIDAVVWSGGLPTAGVTDLTSSIQNEIEFVPVDDLLPAMQKEYGDIYQEDVIPAGTYEQPGAVGTISVPNLLVVNKDMDAGLARKLTSLVFKYQDDLAKVHPEAENITRELAPKTAPVQLHPGAKKYLSGG